MFYIHTLLNELPNLGCYPSLVELACQKSKILKDGTAVKSGVLAGFFAERNAKYNFNSIKDNYEKIKNHQFEHCEIPFSRKALVLIYYSIFNHEYNYNFRLSRTFQCYLSNLTVLL